MSRSRERLFTLLQGFATVAVAVALVLPMSASAATKKAVKARKVPSVLVKKGEVKLTSSKKGRAGSVALASRRTNGKASRLAKAEDGRSSRRVALGKRQETRATSRLAVTRNNRADRAPLQLVAHHPSVASGSSELRSSFGERQGLRSSGDPLELNSSVALVVDQQTNEVLFSKNEAAVLPIASLTKLMTGLVVTDANLPMDELITITTDDIDTVKGSRSRLAVGTTLTRREMMHLALMSSENRAAHALGRTYPGGLDQFVRLMNAKAREIGMRDTRYVEPTGLSSSNQSSARDLATLVSVAYQRPILRSLTTSPSHQLDLGNRTLEFRNSNGLIRNPEWEIGLQKTGYITEAGRCLVMQARVAGRQLIMVFLDAAGKLGRAQDAERVRRWVETQAVHAGVSGRPQG